MSDSRAPSTTRYGPKKQKQNKRKKIKIIAIDFYFTFSSPTGWSQSLVHSSPLNLPQRCFHWNASLFPLPTHGLVGIPSPWPALSLPSLYCSPSSPTFHMWALEYVGIPDPPASHWRCCGHQCPAFPASPVRLMADWLVVARVKFSEPCLSPCWRGNYVVTIIYSCARCTDIMTMK